MATCDPTHPDFQQLPPFQQLAAIMAALRAPDGCPWDLKQTHQTLTPYLVEEVFECIEAIEANDMPQVCEELGDILLQVVFHAQLARERGDFGHEDVCRSIVDKMIRRHPHVFAKGPNLDSAEQVLEQWDDIKKREKAQSASALDGVSRGLPALSQAALLQKRAARTGFAYSDAAAAWAKFREEVAEFQDCPSQEELGDVFFALVSVAHQHGLDPESALRATNRKFRDRFAALEERFPQGFRQQDPSDLVAAWKEFEPR